MKKTLSIFFISLLSGALTLGGYKILFENKQQAQEQITTENALPNTTQASRITPITGSLDFTKSAESTVNAVVHVKNLSYITTRSNPLLEFFYGYKGGTQAQVGTGSGVIITEDGYIVTNNHVIANSSELEVTLNNDETYKAKLIGTDKQMDIALLKIEPKDKLPYIVFGDSDNIQLGEWVLAVGNPFNLTSTVTAGIVSAKARNLSKTGIQSFIQTDAAINPGNSGGALVNTRGELIGINTMISSNTGSYVGYAFAVPSNVTRKIVEDLLEYGNVQQGVLGVSGFELNQQLIAELNLKNTKNGFYVKEITPNSGAEKAGIKTGDIITKINNKDIKTFVDIKSVLNTKRPNDLVDILFIRDNEPQETKIALIKRENQQFAYKGIEFEELSDEEREENNVNYGIKIVRITDKELSNYKRELEGSLLISINGIKIMSINQAKNILNQVGLSQKIKADIITLKGEHLRLLI